MKNELVCMQPLNFHLCIAFHVLNSDGVETLNFIFSIIDIFPYGTVQNNSSKNSWSKSIILLLKYKIINAKPMKRPWKINNGK